MQEPNSSDNVREIFIDTRQKPPKTQDPCGGENIQVLLEVEVIESLYPSVSRDGENFAKQGVGVVEVMIIRPGTTDTVVNPHNYDTAGTIGDMTEMSDDLRHRQKPHRILATSATDRRHIPHYDSRLNKSFVVGNVVEGPAIMMGEIVGDLPSKVDDTVHATMNHLRQGDHCNDKAAAAELLKSYVDFCNCETEIGEVVPPLPSANAMVYRVNPEVTASRNYPLVEFSAAQRILDTYTPDGSRCRDKNGHQIIDAMKSALAEWGSDEKRIANTLSNDDSALTRCEHCGVISLKKSVISCQIPVPNTIDKYKKCLSTKNSDNVREPNTRIPQSEPKDDNPGSKFFVPVQNGPMIQSTKAEEDPGELILQRPEQDYIGSSPAVNPVTAECESDHKTENMKKMTNVGSKTKLKTMCVNTKEQLNDTRFRSTSFSRQFLRQGVTKAVEKSVRNTCDSGNKRNVDLAKNKTNSHSREANDNIDNPIETRAEHVTTREALLPQDSLLKNKFRRSLVQPSHIPTKLEKTKSAEPSSCENLGSYSERKKGKQLPVSKSSENQSQLADLRLWMNEAAPQRNIHEDVDLANLPKNPLHPYTVSSNDRSSIDQKYEGNLQPSISVDDRRSGQRTKNHKPQRCNPDLYHSAPLISSTKEASMDEDLAIDNRSPTQSNRESETTGFSSSSSEHVIREWANRLAEDLRVDRNPLTVKSQGEAMGGLRSLRTQIDSAIGKSTSHTNSIEQKPHSHESVARIDKTLKLDPQDYDAKAFDRFKDINCHYFSADEETLPSSSPKEIRYITETISGLRSQMTPSRRNIDNFGKSSKNSLKITYKNVASTISSISGCCNVDDHELDFRQDTLRDGKDESISELNGSEVFERQIKYDEISSKDISTESNENLEAEILPMYRKILESKDEMDWRTFQQLVETLHPSQRELWCDICKAVSNEAKRVAGETGTSTEVCIEINPVPTRQVFPPEQKTKVKTSDDGMSFEMDMILTDSESFFDPKSHASSKVL